MKHAFGHTVTTDLVFGVLSDSSKNQTPLLDTFERTNTVRMSWLGQAEKQQGRHHVIVSRYCRPVYTLSTIINAYIAQPYFAQASRIVGSSSVIIWAFELQISALSSP